MEAEFGVVAMARGQPNDSHQAECVRQGHAKVRKMPRLITCKSLILVVREGLEPSTSAL
jgi:hypothetical protein